VPRHNGNTSRRSRSARRRHFAARRSQVDRASSATARAQDALSPADDPSPMASAVPPARGVCWECKAPTPDPEFRRCKPCHALHVTQRGRP
jgi:hypothetical protein